MELYKLKHSQFEQKGTEIEQNAARMSNFLDSIGLDHNAVRMETCTLLKKREKRPQGQFRDHWDHRPGFNRSHGFQSKTWGLDNSVKQWNRAARALEV